MEQVEDHRKPDGSFHFKLCYPDLLFHDPCLHWEQTTNPTINDTIQGFRLLRDGGLDPAIDGCSGCSFTGLHRQKSGTSQWGVALVSGDSVNWPSGGSQWWSIGIFDANGLRDNTLAGPKGQNFTRRVELWVERAQESSTMTVDEHGNMEHYKEVRMEVAVCHTNTSDDASDSIFTAEVKVCHIVTYI